MRKRVRTRPAVTSALAAVAAALLGVPAVAGASGPGVDEYTLNIPGGGGNHPFNGNHPPGTGGTGSGGGSLPASVQGQLSGTQGALLGEIANSPSLGAPQTRGHAPQGRDDRAGSSNSPGSPAAKAPSSSFAGAAFRTAGDGSSVLLFGGILAAAALAGGSLLRLRTRPTRGA